MLASQKVAEVVTPAKAGVQNPFFYWILAFAGMTEKSIFRLPTSAKKNPEKLPLSSQPAIRGVPLDLSQHRISLPGPSY
jgi:hypothetical protein